LKCGVGGCWEGEEDPKRLIRVAEDQIERTFRRCCEGEALAVSPHGDGIVNSLIINGHDALIPSCGSCLVIIAGCVLNNVPPSFCIAGDIFGLFVEEQEKQGADPDENCAPPVQPTPTLRVCDVSGRDWCKKSSSADHQQIYAVHGASLMNEKHVSHCHLH
jgi:hypothetical protein